MIDCNDGLTVSRVEPLILPVTALIVLVPAANAVARPCVPAALLIVATPVFDELHCTVFVMSCTLLSVNVPVAVNCCFKPNAIEGIAGVTAIDTTVAGVTVAGEVVGKATVDRHISALALHRRDRFDDAYCV